MFYNGFVNHYQDLFPFRESTFDFLRSQCPPDASRVLDLGCATGHYAAAFANAGYHSVGIDLEPDMIKYARSHYSAPQFHTMDMLNIPDLNQTFDLIYSTGNTLSHLDPAMLGKLTDNLRKVLNPGGVWLFQTVNWDYLLTLDRHEFPVLEAPDKGLRFYRRYLSITNQGVIFRILLQQNDKLLYDAEQTLYPVTAQQYQKIHENAGFKPVGHYADFKSNPFNPNVNSANIMIFKTTTWEGK